MSLVRRSIRIALVVTCILLVFGYGASMALAHVSKAGVWLVTAIYLPFFALDEIFSQTHYESPSFLVILLAEIAAHFVYYWLISIAALYFHGLIKGRSDSHGV